MTSRFMFEEAEKVLDAFADGPRYLAFKRTYRKFKFMLAAYAFTDYADDTRPEDEKLFLSYAWEDAQMAFTGHGEMALMGLVLQMWSYLRRSEKGAFGSSVKEAFGRAEEVTPTDAPRRFLEQHRLRSPRKPEEGFDLPTILPMSGVRLREWAVDNKEDVKLVEEQWYWIELMERREKAQRAGVTSPLPGAVRKHLHLVIDE